MDRGKGYRWFENLRLLRVRFADGVERRWVIRVSLSDWLAFQARNSGFENPGY